MMTIRRLGECYGYEIRAERVYNLFSHTTIQYQLNSAEHHMVIVNFTLDGGMKLSSTNTVCYYTNREHCYFYCKNCFTGGCFNSSDGDFSTKIGGDCDILAFSEALMVRHVPERILTLKMDDI